MKILNTVFFIILSILFVSACKEEKNYTYNYLLQHPLLLDREYANCKKLLAKTDVTEEQKNECQVINNAADRLRDSLTSLREDPEKVGLQIMIYEYNYVTAKNQIKEIEENLKKLKSLDLNKEVIDKEENALKAAQNRYETNLRLAREWLSILALYGPE